MQGFLEFILKIYYRTKHSNCFR